MEASCSSVSLSLTNPIDIWVPDQIDVIELDQFDKAREGFNIPEKTENRKITDKKWLLDFPIALLIFLALLIYIFAMGFGQSGTKQQDVYTSVSFLDWGAIFSAAFLAVALNAVLFLLFRYATKTIVWGILILFLIITGIITIEFWILSYQRDTYHSTYYLYPALGSTLIFIIFALFLRFSFKRINLVAILFHESTQAIFDMPGIITTIPFISTLILIAIWIPFWVSLKWILFPGRMCSDYEDRLNNDCVGDTIFVFIIDLTKLFGVFLTVWLTLIITGCQYMTTAGSVATWYFARNRKAPVKTSLWHAVRYHIGSVVLGALIRTLTVFLKIILQTLAKNKNIKGIIKCCTTSVDQLIKFSIDNAYIEVAIHGQNFFKSGKRAIEVLSVNPKNTIAINLLVSFVIIMCEIIVLGVCSFFFHEPFFAVFYWLLEVELVTADIAIAGVPFAITVYFLGAYKNIIDSLYICCCEDIVMNNGTTTQPYRMNKNLAKIFNEAKNFHDEIGAV